MCPIPYPTLQHRTVHQRALQRHRALQRRLVRRPLRAWIGLRLAAARRLIRLRCPAAGPHAASVLLQGGALQVVHEQVWYRAGSHAQARRARLFLGTKWHHGA